VIAAGKVAPQMVLAFVRHYPGRIGAAVVVSSVPPGTLPAAFESFEAGHPLPDEASEAAGRRALEVSRRGTEEPLVVLLSGGASALLAVPADGLSLADKREVTSHLLLGGADITALNIVRKHLSAIKGGLLAASQPGLTIALAVSDVIGDDLSAIASGPTVADASTFGDALAVLDRFGGRRAYPARAVARLERGVRGEIAETPKPGDTRLAGSVTRVIGSARDLVAGATRAAHALGYAVVAIDEPVTGEARDAARWHVPQMLASARSHGGRVAVVSAGETTVHVAGTGTGGRNQEFSLAAAAVLAEATEPVVFASAGSDGIDGPTDAAGALADATTTARAAAIGLAPGVFLEHNDSYHFFRALGDLLITGPTGTNVGDIQVLLADFTSDIS
jgi:glycerate-2-kinase